MIEHFDAMQNQKRGAWLSQMSAVDKLLEIFCSDHPIMVPRWREIERKAELHGLRARIAELEAGVQSDLADVTLLPDGSGFGVISYPLPADHWLYAPREYGEGEEEPKELPAPLLDHSVRDTVVQAVRYAVRGATMCGKESDFDPDALVQNAVYALCGPFAARVKCDGNHGGPRCADPGCWNDSPEQATPSAKWRVAGEPDPHDDQYDCERAKLVMGDLTDDELANAVYLHGNGRPRIEDVIAGKATMPIVYLTAAKDRIRWLSRALEKAIVTAPVVPHQELLRSILVEAIREVTGCPDVKNGDKVLTDTVLRLAKQYEVAAPCAPDSPESEQQPDLSGEGGGQGADEYDEPCPGCFKRGCDGQCMGD